MKPKKSSFSLWQWIRLLRVYQWTKSTFVVLPGVFSGQLIDHGPAGWVLYGDNIARVFWAMLGFSLVASAVYILNDWKDRELDRRDPIKRKRPLAAGTIHPVPALTMALVLVLLSLGGSLLLGERGLALIFGLYLVLNLFYTTIGKQIVLIDVFLIALFFILRVLAGVMVLHIAASPWLLVCSFFLSLFLAFSKRFFESSTGDPESMLGGGYSLPFLDPLISICGGLALLSYALFTLQPKWVHSWLYTTIPLVALGIFRFLLVLHDDRVRDKNPSAVLVRDRFMLVVVSLWFLQSLVLVSLFPPRLTG